MASSRHRRARSLEQTHGSRQQSHPVFRARPNALSVDYRNLAPKYARTPPGHGQIPAAFISMIGVEQGFQGTGYGGDLLVACVASPKPAKPWALPE